MRLLHTADLHLGLVRYGRATPQGNSRILDFLATWDRLVATAIEHKVELVILAGDTFESRFERPEERAAFVAGLTMLRLAGIRVIVLPGNHDGMTTLGEPSSHSLRWLHEAQIQGVRVILEPQIGEEFWGVSVSAMGYPHKRMFDALLPELTPDERVQEAGSRLDNIMTVMAEQARAKHPDLPQLFVGHLTVLGATAGSEVTMKASWDVALRAEVLDAFDYGALGHIHRQQPVGARAWYAGSPDNIDYGEVGQTKGFLLVDVEAGKPPSIEGIPSRPRPMIEMEAVEVGSAYEVREDLPDGAMVRLFVRPAERVNQSALGALIRQLYEAGASHVKKEVIPPPITPRARIEVDADLDITEATTRWFVANGHPVEPAITRARELIAG